MQGTEALPGRQYLRPVSQQERLYGQHTETSSRDCTPSGFGAHLALPKGFIRDTARGALTWWNAVEPSKQPVYIVTGISLAVWGLWNVPRLTGFMVRNFVQALPPAAGSRRVLPMLLANYSHSSIWHLGFNSLALLSFGPLLVQNYGAPQFLAFFASAGVASSLMAHAGRLRAAVPSGSLGMSGAVYAVVVAVATLYPKLQAQFIFLPFIPITLDVLVPGLVMLDLAGAVRGWRFMDHFGHLGGALAGYWYANWGRQLIWQQRDKWLPPPDPKAKSAFFRRRQA
eukprot:jgi/Astpho2/7226/Aster-x1427